MKGQGFRLLGIITILLLAACGSAGEAVGTSTLTLIPTMTPDKTLISSTASSLFDESLKQTQTVYMPRLTRTLEPTATPTAVPISAADFPQNLPESFTYDLVWVQEGSLLHWDAQDGELVVVVGIGQDAQVQVDRPVVHAETYESGKAVVVLAEEEENTYRLVLVDVWDFSSQELVTVVSRKEFPNFSLSPDGKWLGYFDVIDQQDNDILYDFKAIELETLEDRTLASCIDDYWTSRRRCGLEMLWKPSSDLIAVHADGGLWLLDPEVWFSMTTIGNRRLLQPNIWISAGSHMRPVPVDWSPDEKYILVWDLLWEGDQMVVIEPSTNRVEKIPFAEYFYGSGDYQVNWLENNRLLVFHMPHGNIANVYIYRVQSSGSQMLQLERSKELALDFDFYIYSIEIRQVSGNEVKIMLGNSFNHYAILNFDINRLEFLSGFEKNTGEKDYQDIPLVWSTHGDWLFIPSVGELISTDGQYSFDLSGVLSEDAADFTFVPHEEESGTN